MTPEELEAERLRLQAEASTNPMMQPTNLIGQQAPREDVNPFALAGLGGAAFLGQNLPAGGVNPQVTGPVSQGLFQSSNIIGRNLPAGGANPQVTGPVSQGYLRPAPNQPVLIGQPQSYQGVPTGPNTPPQFTGNAPARPIPGTQLTPPNQPPAVRSTGGPPAVSGAKVVPQGQTTAKPGTANYSVNRTAPYTMGPAKQFASGVLKTGLIGALTTPNTMADATLGGAYDRRVAAGEDPDQVRQSLGLASDYREIQPLSGADLELANQYAAAYTAEQAGSEAVASPPQNALLDLAEQAGSEAVASPPQNALLDLAERENALGPKLTDIFQGRAEALSTPTENPIDATDPGPVAAPGSPQAIFEEAKKLGLGDRDVAGFEKVAARMGTTFDPVYGFSRDPFLQTQADAEYLANRPGYGYAGAANDQYRSADLDTISQGVFDTPMTGMRPINAETGEPLSQGVIDAAARAGLELPMGSVPLPKAPVNSVPMGRDATRARLGGMTLNQYLNAPDGTEGVYGLRTDPQGRMIPGGAPGTSQTRADAYGQYEDEVSQAYQRQSNRMQQLADQRDGTAGPRTYGGYTTSQLRGMVGGGDNLRAAQMRAEAGLNPVTGNRESTEEQNQLQTEVLKARLAQLKEQEPDKLSQAESYADRLNLQGDARTALIFAQMGTSMDDIFGLEGTSAGGGGGAVPDSIVGLAAQYSGKTLTGPDGTKYKSDGTSWTKVQ